LGLPFLTELEEWIRGIVQAQEGEKRDIHEEARVFVTAEPHNSFPIGLLQMSIKVTNEPPVGIKAGIIRSYSWLSQDVLESFHRPEWKPLLFTLCFLHSVVVERRKFGPIGFAVPYEFNQGDWTASVMFLQNHLTLIGEDVRKGQVNWETVNYMIAEIQYGGRITDNKDRELFNTITAHYFGQIRNIPKGETVTFCTAKADANDKDSAPKKYSIPLMEEIQKHREFIRDTFPDVDAPDVFGMHPNADITYRTAQAREILSTILDVQPRGSGEGSGPSRETRVLTLTASYLTQLPEKWNPDKKEKLGDRQPLSIFAGQEIDRLRALIQAIRSTCADLKLAIDGSIIMTPKLQDTLDFVGDARVPPHWVAVSWPSPSVSSWFTDVLKR
jgi:dynein heavy chain